MPKFTVYEKQILLVAHEVTADNAAEAANIVEMLCLHEYDFVVESETSIHAVEPLEE